MPPKRLRKSSRSPSPPSTRARAAKTAALNRDFSKPRGGSFSPFVRKSTRNRFAHYPPPPGEELNNVSARLSAQQHASDEDANNNASDRHDNENERDSSHREEELLTDEGNGASSDNVDVQVDVEGADDAAADDDADEDASLQQLIDVDAPAARPLVGDVVPEYPQHNAEEDEVVRCC